MRNIITFMLEEIKSRMRDIVIFLKEIKFRNVEMLLYLLKNQLLTKIDFQMLAIELIIVRIMTLKQSKKRKAFFRKRKFDVLIEFILLRILFTRNCSAFIKEISFFYFFV
jgi:membrane protease YdiL (CAAX protease family)